MRTRSWIGVLVCGLLLAGPAGAKKAAEQAREVAATEEVPAEAPVDPTDPEALVARAQAAMGGPEGGPSALTALPGYKLTYRMKVHDTRLGKSYTADHVYERTPDGATRLEVDLVEGSGEDSVAYAGAEQAWVQVDGVKTEFQPAEVLGRVDDFSPESLFQVPLDLAGRGMESFPEELRPRLEAGPFRDDEGRERIRIRGIDTAGVEQLTVVLHTGTGRPTMASFRSVAGDIEYHFDDYREVAPGLVLPFVRVFVRNGVVLSELSVKGFEVLAETPAAGAEEGAGEPGGEASAAPEARP